MIFPRVKSYLRKKICSRGTVAAILLLIMALTLPAVLTAQSFVYVNNQNTANTVSGFSVGITGGLIPTPGSPYSTGGAGSTVTCFGLDRMVVSTVDQLLFVSNSADQTISAFQINPTTGALTIVSGSPIFSGLSLDSCNGISLAVTPDGRFLMASSGGAIQSFSIAAGGILTPAVLTSPAVPSTTVGMKISPNGTFLALSNETGVSMYANNNGTLTPVVGTPFPSSGTGQLSGLEFSCAADALYGSEASFSSTIADAWSVSAAGALTPMAGSPFLTLGADSNVVALTPDNTMLYTSDQLNDTITGFNVAAGGVLAGNTRLTGGSSVHIPTGLAVDPSGNFLFVGDDIFGLSVFSIAGDGSLTPLSNVATVPGNEIQSLTTYPTRSCVSTDLNLSMTPATAIVSTGSTVTFTLSVTNTAATPVSLMISDVLPAGLSFVSSTPAPPPVTPPVPPPITPCTFGAVAGFCGPTLASPMEITFPSIPAGKTATVQLAAIASTSLLDGALLTNTATITNRSAIQSALAVSVATSALTISSQPSASAITIPTVTTTYGGTATLTAVLTKTSNQGDISGKTLTFTFNGAAVGSAVTNFLGQASVNVSVAGLALGSYPGAITASFSTIDPLFGTSTGTGTLTITPAVLTVASNFTIFYADAIPAPLPFTVTGFVGTDTLATAVTGAPACATLAHAAVTTPTLLPPSAAGTYPTSCTLGTLGASNYTFVMAPGILTIAPAPITVVVNNATRLYGQPNVFTSTVTGAKNNETVIPIYQTVAGINSPVGTYQVVPVAPINYTVTAATDGVLTITAAPLSVVVNNASRPYADANPLFSGTITGELPGDGITAQYSTTATIGSPAGLYPITPQFNDPNGKLSNYTVTITNGVLTVTPGVLTVTALDASRLYGSANPVFTGTITGLNPADGITASYTTAATVASPVGTYAIVPVLSDPLGKLGNYTVTLVPGTLTITPAPLTVTTNSATRVYGNANPTLSGTITGLKNGDVITATYSSVGVTSPVGTFAITATLIDPGAKLGNYAVTTGGGGLTITPAPLAVTAVGGTRVFGGVNPAATITGLKNGDAITATYTTPTSSSPAGTYTLTPVLVDPNSLLGNYTVTIKTAVLTITKAPLTVTATSAIAVLNSTTPGFTATFTGFVLGQTAADLTGTLNCTATVSAIGAHPLTCSGLTSTNYALTFVAGTATVDYAPVGACTSGPGHQILAPINADGSSVFPRATTSTIPIQFRVCDATGKAVSTGGIVTNFRLLQKITGGVTTNVNQGQSTGFAFSTANQDLALSLGTSAPTNLAAGSTYVYQITLNDGTTINFQFSLN
jgi:hypothetical protein